MLKKLPDHFIGRGLAGSDAVRKLGRGRARDDEFICSIDLETRAAISNGIPTPVRLGERHGRIYWWYRGEIYGTDERDLTPEDVDALLNEQLNKRRLRIQKARDLQARARQLDEKGQRQAIPAEVKTFVWRRDRGQCVTCGSNKNLEFDHTSPLAMGGQTQRGTSSSCARTATSGKVAR